VPARNYLENETASNGDGRDARFVEGSGYTKYFKEINVCRCRSLYRGSFVDAG
jgi:hypothetical protein